MVNPTAVWRYYDLCCNTPNRAQCKLCHNFICRGSINDKYYSVNNLHNHLKNFHGGELIGNRYYDLKISIPKDTSVTIINKFTAKPVSENDTSTLTMNQQDQPCKNDELLNTVPCNVNQANLKWKTHHKSMQTSLLSQLEHGLFVDAILVCEGKSLKCHKMILSACSDYLKELLCENPYGHSNILMVDFEFWELEALVKFIYCGEIGLPLNKLKQFLHTVKVLQLKNPASMKTQLPSHNITESKCSKKRHLSTDAWKTRICTKICLRSSKALTLSLANADLKDVALSTNGTENLSTKDNEDSFVFSCLKKLVSIHDEDGPLTRKRIRIIQGNQSSFTHTHT